MIKLHLFDYAFLAFNLWTILAYIIPLGVGDGIEYGGSLALESCGSYFVARVFIRDEKSFRGALGFIFLAILIAGVFALPESLFGRHFVHEALHKKKSELPQVINVLKGEMSLVGPRPHAVVHNQEYSEGLERYSNRHQVKPGITGWAQVNGFRGETRDHNLMKMRVMHDLYYINHWSLLFDLKIILMTPFFGLINRNAY